MLRATILSVAFFTAVGTVQANPFAGHVHGNAPYPGAPVFVVQGHTGGWLHRDFDTIREAEAFKLRYAHLGFEFQVQHFSWGHRVKYRWSNWTDLNRFYHRSDAQNHIAFLNRHGLGFQTKIAEVGGIYKSNIQIAPVIKR